MAGLFPAALAGIDAIIGAVWLLILLLNLAELRGHRQFTLLDSSPPSSADLVSVVIPARNEEERIGHCLLSVLHQTHANLQVIVVNDRSSDRTPEIVRELAKADARVSML